MSANSLRTRIDAAADAHRTKLIQNINSMLLKLANVCPDADTFSFKYTDRGLIYSDNDFTVLYGYPRAEWDANIETFLRGYCGTFGLNFVVSPIEGSKAVMLTFTLPRIAMMDKANSKYLPALASDTEVYSMSLFNQIIDTRNFALNMLIDTLEKTLLNLIEQAAAAGDETGVYTIFLENKHRLSPNVVKYLREHFAAAGCDFECTITTGEIVITVH